MWRRDTIAAIASSLSMCARIIIRVSGPQTWDLLTQTVCEGESRRGRYAAQVRLNVDGMIVPAGLIVFEGPHSYSGEDSAELHLPGNPLLAQLTLQHLYAAGARAAEPGEFTARAFFNGRLDLAEAEGVAATIAAGNQRELDAARRLQGGELSRRLRSITDQLAQTLALVEAGIDFSEEQIEFLTPAQLAEQMQAVVDALRELMQATSRFEQLSHEPQVVLCGWPNAGKSTLLNALAGRPRAVVSPVSGTTRDLISAEIELPRGTVRIIDTAGLELDQSDHVIARQMQEMARRAIESADVVVLVHGADDARPLPPLPRQAELLVFSKVDLKPGRPGGIAASAITGQGIDTLRARLDELVFGDPGGERLALSARHIRQIELALEEMRPMIGSSMKPDELVAHHLRLALDALGEITGLISPDDLLDRVFSTFCIGK